MASLFWRRKVRLLLVTGDEAAINNLVPNLKTSQWLEGDRTVLIYGGSLNDEIDGDKYAALRKLRRGRPLDGIVRVIGEGQDLSPQMSDNDLRGLEKIGELLCYSAPVYLWQLCGSIWSQAGRKPQSVGVTFPLRAMPDDVAPQFDKLLAQLREQGLSQIAENQRYDFLLRLAQQFEQGGSKRWTSRLTPWLHSSQQRVPLRGLMFSLADKPENPLAETTETTTRSAHQHALTFPVTWQGVVEDCTRVRGRRVSMAWEQTLAWVVMAAIGVWGVGMLLSFVLNHHQISSVADICLFGEMLSRFFALYTDIYLFNRLIIILQPTGERLEWEEKHNRRIPG